MGRTITALRVLVGYPDDVAEERDVLDEVVEELNRIWSHSHGIRIELIDWKTHSWPNFGSDSQAVINTEVGDDYDIFLGIMWMKFGEPTPRAGSGTAEEFNRALDRFKNNPTTVRIMFYFKEAPPQSLGQIDTEQLQMVRDFKKRIADEGGLYFEFTDRMHFASALRLHLTRQAEEYGKSWGIDTTGSVPSIDSTKGAPSRVTPEDEEGFLDLIERSVEEFDAAGQVLSRITAIQATSTKDIRERTEELSDLNKANAEIKQRKRVLHAIAESMDKYSSTLEQEIPRLSQHHSVAVDAFTRATSIWSEDFDTGQEQVASALQQLQGMLSSENEYLTAIASMREVVNSMPRVTSDFNRSKRRLILAIDSLTTEIEREIELGDQLLAHLQKILSGTAYNTQAN